MKTGKTIEEKYQKKTQKELATHLCSRSSVGLERESVTINITHNSRSQVRILSGAKTYFISFYNDIKLEYFFPPFITS